MSRHHPHLPVRTVASCSGSKLSNGNRSAGTPLHRLLGSYFYQMQMEKNELLSSPYECAVLQEACVAQMQPSTECPQQALLNCFAWPSIRLLPAHELALSGIGGHLDSRYYTDISVFFREAREICKMVKSRRIRSKAARRLDSLVTAAERIYDEAQQAQPGVFKQDVPAAGLHLRALVFDADIKSVW
uniref:Uncharacterized protein n=1 Tax=Oryza rufipogon TaxID=4529 RepID=A0A0E0PXP6_ORYRU